MSKSVQVLARTTIARGVGLLERVTLAYRRYDGRPQDVEREVYTRGDAAAILLYDPTRGTIILERQVRPAAFLNGGEVELIEVPAGKLEGLEPARRIVEEVLEETGYRIDPPREVFVGYMSPAAFSEKLTFFVAPYSPGRRVSDGGGLDEEGEDIQVFETTLEAALAMIDRREIIDIKTIALLHYAALHRLLDAP